MPFFISNSENHAATRAIVFLLTLSFLYCAGLEVVTRRTLSRVSRIQRRIYQDLTAARSIAPRVSNEPPSILVVGNSLLLVGADRASLKEELAPNYHVDLLPIENTQIEDWYFGLRRLFAEGSRPSIVVICLSTRQMMSHATDGEFFAYYLMQGHDLLAVKKESQLDNTMTSAYFFAHSSMWLGSRGQIHNWLIQKIMPNLEHLIGYFPAKAPPMPPKEQVVAEVLPNLLALHQLCTSNGARLVVIIPPTLVLDDASADVQDSAAHEGIPVLVPLRSSDVAQNEFGDGFHLNPRGAARFTPRLASALLQSLNTTRPNF